MHKEVLKQRIVASMGSEADLHHLQKDVARYQVTPKQFWQTVADTCRQQAGKVKEFCDNYERPEYVYPPVVKIAMDHLAQILNYAERMVIVFNRDRVVN